jgi:hypothetical protein
MNKVFLTELEKLVRAGAIKLEVELDKGAYDALAGYIAVTVKLHIGSETLEVRDDTHIFLQDSED